MTKTPQIDSETQANRRRQLQRWIDEKFNGLQSAFIASTNDGNKQLNQGELSALLRTKSFGERRAASLEAQAHMPKGYLDQKPTITTHHFVEQSRGQPVNLPASKMTWPFKNVGYRRLIGLELLLGKSRYAEALSDIDEQLDIVVSKWEKRATHDKRRSAP